MGIIEIFVLLTTLILFIQGSFLVVASLYTWRRPETVTEVKPSRLVYGQSKTKFSLIIPARHEENIIKETLLAYNQIDYPRELLEVFVVVRVDDSKTTAKIKEALKEINYNLQLIAFDDLPINKPKGLNEGLKGARGDFVGIFDAEDRPHPEILKTIDFFLEENPGTDVVQGGVQLINLKDNWFTPLSCLEYYYWFKSVIPLLSKLTAVPLGGNTIFIKRSALEKLKGWDETILTEDADLGIRLSSLNYKIGTIYSEELATLEETPKTITSFIQQRTRWVQGFLQTIAKGWWRKQKDYKKQVLTFYLLSQPIIHSLLTFLFLLGPLFSFFVRVPVWLSLISYLPLYFLFLHWGLILIGLWHLKCDYQIKVTPSLCLKAILFYFPYQTLVLLAFLRAVTRMLLGNFSWEKTAHYEIDHFALAGLKE